ncbi:MAG: hypothetical protein KF823_00900 [Xanthomonadales bacterium]|nr:hypothetical protein [Xanthomonadales bacterium]
MRYPTSPRPAGLAALLAIALAGPTLACSPEDLSTVPLGYNIDYETQVQPIFDLHCDGCHIGGAFGNLSLDPGVSYANLVNVPADNAAAMRDRVEPDDIDASFLFRKINCENLDDAYGLRMPRSGPPYLSLLQQSVIMDWINEGAFPLADPDRIFGYPFDPRVNATPF